MNLEKEKVFKILHVIEHGPIKCIGGTVYDYEMKFLNISNVDMADIIPFLNGLLSEQGSKLRIERTDSGGSPTWNLC